MAINRSFFTERRVVESVASYFREQGYAVAEEVPSGSQSIDIVALESSNVTAIEVKLSKWSVALDQCRSHEASADFICIAVALKTIPDRLKLAIANRGYGLLRVNSEDSVVSWVVRPKRNVLNWLPEKRKLMEKVEEYTDER